MDVDTPAPKQPVLIFQFPFSQTKSVSFHTIIRSDDFRSREILAKTTFLRDELMKALDGGSASGVLGAAEAYIPYMYGLVIAVENNPNLRLNVPLAYSWTSSFSGTNQPFVAYTYRFEIIMTLFVYAIAHINKAYELMSYGDASFDENCKKASPLLKTAAGIFEFIHVYEYSRWVDLPVQRPLELNSEIILALQQYSLASAQLIMLKKGLMSNTSKSLMAKLAVECWKQFDSVVAAFKSFKEYKKLFKPLRRFLPILTGLAKATAYKYMGMASYNEEKYGLAAGYLEVASLSIIKMKKPQPGSALSKYAKEIEDSIAEIEHLKRKYVLENNNVYFQSVLPETQLPIFDAKNAAGATQWLPPQPAFDRLV